MMQNTNNEDEQQQQQLENQDQLTEKANPQEESYDSNSSQTIPEEDKLQLEVIEDNFCIGSGDFKDQSSQYNITQNNLQPGMRIPQTRKKERKTRKKSQMLIAEGDNKPKNGRWSMMEHVRFLEALKNYGKNWKKVEEHVATRTSTQARSHAQKFFANILKKNMTMEQFLDNLSHETLQELRINAQKNIDGGNESQLDGEAEVDKLLMMHMAKNIIEDEQVLRNESSSQSSKIIQEQIQPFSEVNLKQGKEQLQQFEISGQRKESISRKKRTQKQRVMNMAIEQIGKEKLQKVHDATSFQSEGTNLTQTQQIPSGSSLNNCLYSSITSNDLSLQHLQQQSYQHSHQSTNNLLSNNLNDGEISPLAQSSSLQYTNLKHSLTPQFPSTSTQSMINFRNTENLLIDNNNLDFSVGQIQQPFVSFGTLNFADKFQSDTVTTPYNIQVSGVDGVIDQTLLQENEEDEIIGQKAFSDVIQNQMPYANLGDFQIQRHYSRTMNNINMELLMTSKRIGQPLQPFPAGAEQFLGVPGGGIGGFASHSPFENIVRSRSGSNFDISNVEESGYYGNVRSKQSGTSLFKLNQ